jgi:hypothetical protein
LEVTDEVARRLARALNDVVPDDVALAALPGPAIKIVAGEGGGWTEVRAIDWSDMDWSGVRGRSPVEVFADAVLRQVQDEVIEFSVRGGWPSADPDHPGAPQRSVDLPEPHAEIAGGELRCWYGSRVKPAPNATAETVVLKRRDRRRRCIRVRCPGASRRR